MPQRVITVLSILASAALLLWPPGYWRSAVRECSLPGSVRDAVEHGDWRRIATEANGWVSSTGFKPIAALLEGYAALYHAQHNDAARHLLIAARRLSPADLAELQALGANCPGSLPAQLLAAHASSLRRDATQIKRFLDRASELDSDETVTRLARAALHTASGAACSDDVEALIDDPKCQADGLVLKGIDLLDRGMLPEAECVLGVAVQVAPDCAIAWNTRGVVRAQLGMWDAAAADFLAAYQANAELAEARTNWRLAQRVAENPGALLSMSGERRPIQVLVSDFGINNWNSKMKLGEDFKFAKAGPLIPGLPSAGQILVPMPDDQHFPTSGADRERLSASIARDIITRIDRGQLSTYEVRIAQNINTPGYFAPWRQSSVREFGTVVYEALASVKSHYSGQDRPIEMPAIVGSNGAYLLTEAVSQMKKSPIDRVVFVDGRAYLDKVKQVCEITAGQCTVINTAGDAPSFNRMIANHDVAKRLQDTLPNVRSIWVDVKGPDIFVARHLASMDPSASLLVKDHIDGRDYTRPTRMSGWDLMSGATGLRSGSDEMLERSSCGGVKVGSVDVQRGDGGAVSFGSGSEQTDHFRIVLPVLCIPKE